MQNGISRTLAVKNILDGLVREIISGGASGMLQTKYNALITVIW